MSDDTKDDTRVLYNASCPVCRREVEHYGRLSKRAALPIAYDDLSDTDRLTDWGINADDAAKRLHVRKNGQIYSGLPAFIVLWRDIPQTRWLARLFSVPGLHGAASWLYDRALAPLLYRMHLRRRSRGG